MNNTIFLKRKGKVIVSNGGFHVPDVYIASALKNVESLGYTFSSTLIHTLRTLSVNEFVSFYADVLAD